MLERKAEAVWKGDLRHGNGCMSIGSGGSWKGDFSFASRFEQGTGTNPEELIAAAHAGCYSMELANQLASAGYTPTRIATTAKVKLDKRGGSFAITTIELHCVAEVPGIESQLFMKNADTVKTSCPVSKALAGVNIELDAQLISN